MLFPVPAGRFKCTDGVAVGSDVETREGFTAGSEVAAFGWDIDSIPLQPTSELAGINIEAIMTTISKV